MEGATGAIVAVLTAVVGVAIVAVIFGSNSQTPAVIQSASSGFAQILQTAVSPATGSTMPFGGALGGMSPFFGG